MDKIRDCCVSFDRDKSSIGSLSDILCVIVRAEDSGLNISSVTLVWKSKKYILGEQIVTRINTCLKGDGSLHSHICSFLESLSEETYLSLSEEYSLVQGKGTIVDTIVLGIASYLCFLFAYEMDFADLPVQASLPFSVHSGQCCTSNNIELLGLLLSSMSRMSGSPMLQLADFVLKFSDFCQELFVPGQPIDLPKRMRFYVDIVRDVCHVATEEIFNAKAVACSAIQSVRSDAHSPMIHRVRSILTEM